jgi:hypothetical protein
MAPERSDLQRSVKTKCEIHAGTGNSFYMCFCYPRFLLHRNQRSFSCVSGLACFRYTRRFSGTQAQACNESHLSLIPWQTGNVVPGSKVSHETGKVCLVLYVYIMILQNMWSFWGKCITTVSSNVFILYGEISNNYKLWFQLRSICAYNIH